jgi:hypothetical protein
MLFCLRITFNNKDKKKKKTINYEEVFICIIACTDDDGSRDGYTGKVWRVENRNTG